MQTRAIIFAQIICVVLLANADAYEYINAKNTINDKANRINDLIVITTGEKILIKEKKRIAERVVFVLPCDFVPVLTVMRDLVNQRLGIIRDETHVTKNYGAFNTTGKISEYNAQLRKSLDRIGVNLDQFQMQQLDTKRYNILPSVGGYSETTIRVLDGAEIFGNACTLVILERTDHWRDWGREWHTGIHIPFKLNMDGSIITETEIQLMEDTKNRLGLKNINYFIPNNTYFPLLDIEMMKKIKETVEKYQQ